MYLPSNLPRMVVTLLLLTACDSPPPVGPPVGEELSGRWVALEAEFVNSLDPAQRLDIVPEGGSLVLDLEADRTFSLLLLHPHGSELQMGETWERDGGRLTLYYAHGWPGTSEFDLHRIGEVLYLVGADTEFDFHGTGEWLPAKLNLVLQRQ